MTRKRYETFPLLLLIDAIENTAHHPRHVPLPGGFANEYPQGAYEDSAASSSIDWASAPSSGVVALP